MNYYIIVALFLSFYSCDVKNKNNIENDVNSQTKANHDQPINANEYPLSSKEVGTYPYLPPPEGYTYSDQAKNMNFAELYRFYNDSSIVSIGGKYYRSTVTKSASNRKEFSDSIIVKHYEQAVSDLGGLEIYAGNKPLKMLDMTDDELSRRPIAGDYRQYIVRTPEGNIWFELNTGYGEAEQAVFSVVTEIESIEPAWFIKAERIRDAIERNHRVALYINFNKNNASLKPDGVAAVEEIAKVMRLDKALRLSVEGHTDQIGTTEFNKRLSSERTGTVIRKLQESKIPAYRLKAASRGAEQMVVASNADENRSLNRRIVLIKTNVDESGLKEALDRDGKAILHIVFDPGKATLKSEEVEITDEITKLMKNDKNLRLSIEGHTDNTGSADLNERLSRERALTITRKLVEAGISSSRLKAAGFGARKPLAPNHSDENRAKNRRVEIVKF